MVVASFGLCSFLAASAAAGSFRLLSGAIGADGTEDLPGILRDQDYRTFNI